MTFELSSEQLELQARARAVSQHLVPLAATVDQDAAIPADLNLGLLLGANASPLDLIVVVEELASVSAAVAAAVGLGSPTPPAASEEWPGLRGLGEVAVASPDGAARQALVLAAVAVGIGRAAIEHAVAEMRASGDRPSGNADDRPHWVLADAATEVEGARLLTMKAAQGVAAGNGLADARLAKLFAAEVAGRAVDAALRILGPAGYRRGTVLERLTRDARTVALLGGTAETDRASVADATLPG